MLYGGYSFDDAGTKYLSVSGIFAALLRIRQNHQAIEIHMPARSMGVWATERRKAVPVALQLSDRQRSANAHAAIGDYMQGKKAAPRQGNRRLLSGYFDDAVRAECANAISYQGCIVEDAAKFFDVWFVALRGS